MSDVTEGQVSDKEALIAQQIHQVHTDLLGHIQAQNMMVDKVNMMVVPAALVDCAADMVASVMVRCGTSAEDMDAVVNDFAVAFVNRARNAVRALALVQRDTANLVETLGVGA